MAPTAPLILPVELIEAVLDAVDSHKDVLAFALTCSYLNGIVRQHGYLQYRELVASEGHVHLWSHLVENPQLAAKVRTMTVYDGWYQSQVHRTSYRLPATISGHIDVNVGRQSLRTCVPLLSGLHAITFFAGPYHAEDDMLAIMFSHWHGTIRSVALRLISSHVLPIDNPVRALLSVYPALTDLITRSSGV